MPDLITNALNQQRDAERILATAFFINPAEAFEQAGYLAPDIFADNEIRQYWRNFLADKDPAKAAMSVSTDFYIRLSTGSLDYPGINTYYDIPAIANQVAQDHWLAALASKLSPLAAAVADRDRTKVKALITDMANHTPQVIERLPDVADIGMN